MKDRIDQKLQDAAVARFRYRHEAEFAAGFLDDAGIPYRLQVDDAAMGMTIATPATLWVRGMDLVRAREVLDLPQRDVVDREHTPLSEAGSSPVAPTLGKKRGVSADRLSAQERRIAAALCAGSLGLGVVAFGGPWLWVAVASTLAAATGAAALFGRTLGPVRRLLRALSGSAP